MSTLGKNDSGELLVRLLIIGLAVFATVVQASNEKPVPDESPSTIGAVISKLESPDFKTRQQATRLLLKMGDRAIEPLLNRVRNGRLELAVRAVSIFEAAYLGKDKAAAAAADLALEELAKSKRQDLAEQAIGVLARNRAMRTRVALGHLKRLGAEAYNYNPNAVPGNFRRGSDPDLVLDKNWKGGVEGLEYVRRLRGTGIQIYLIDGVPLPEKAIIELESVFDSSTIARRGPGMLGIKGDRARNGCLVIEVVEGLAAAKGRLRPGDVIQELDGERVEDFHVLVDMLRSKQAGQVIKLKVERDTPDARVEILNVKLGKWRPPTKILLPSSPEKKPEQKP